MSSMTRAPAMRDRRLIACAAIVLAVTATAAWRKAAADPPADGDLIRDPEVARAVVQRAIDAYRALRTYRQTASTTWHLETGRWLEGVDKPEDRTETSSLSCAAPDRFAVSRGALSALCDGTTLWIHDGDLHQYLQVPRQEVTGPIEGWIEARTAKKLSLPIAGEAMIDRQAGIDDILSDLIGFEGVRPGDRNGRPGRWVVLHIRDIWYRSGERLKIEMWFDDETGFVEEVRGDFTDAYAFAMIAWQGFDNPEPVEIRSSTWVSTHGEVAVNEELAPATFVFQPGPGDRRVDVFEEPQAPRMTQADLRGLIGQPAPDFSGKTLEGADLSLSGLRGRVVLLDFWATWCGPCVQAMPHIQEISARFADAPVTVLGVNRDGPGKDETVRKFVKNKGITFTQVMDRQGSTATSYRVSGIPTTVLIDQAGIVRDVSVGFSPSHKKELIEQIEALVQGREPPVAAHEEAGADDDELLRRLGASGDQDPALLAMIGQLVPEFAATDLGGREVSPTALRDQVGLLYFWMRSGRDGGRPIRSSDLDLHRSIQRVIEQFVGEPFLAVGICRDMHDTADEVKAWLEENSIAVRQVHDGSGDLCDRFAVHMYPCLLLVDKAGVVQDVMTGQRRNMALALEDQVRRLLAGESLIDPKELELRKQAAEAWAERYGLRPQGQASVAVRTAASDLLLKLDRLSGRPPGNQPKRIDVDGDGAEEIVLGGHGELSILSSDGSTLTRVRLAGLDRAQVWDFELVRERGEIRWFAAAMSWETPERDSHVGLFASDGRELWSFEPPEATGSPGQDGKITAGATLAAGDLDGDGTTEYLAGVTYVQWNQAEGDDLRSFGSHMSGHLFVLDGKGAILSQTRLGDSINLIEVVPAAHAGAPATILCGTEKGLERFAFKPQP